MPKYRIDTDKGSYMVETADPEPAIPDAGAQMRASAMAKVSPELRGYTPAELAARTATGNPLSPIQSVSTQDQLENPYRAGLTEAGQGVAQIASHDSARSVAGGLHKVISGATQTMATPALTAGAVLNPVGTALGVGAGVLAQRATTGGLKAVGVPNEYADLAGDAAGFVGGAKADAGARAAGRLVRAGVDRVALPRSGSPVQQAAVDWALAHGAPLDAAAATQNPLVRGVQELAQTTPGASSAAQKAIQARNDWYAAKGRSLAAELSPAEQTPETAGRAVYDQGVKTIRERNKAAGEEYSAFRDREQDPANHREVVTGYTPETVRMQTGTRPETVPGVVGLDGTPATRDVPVYENVTRQTPVHETLPFPVDLRDYKAQFRPVLEQIERQTRLGQSQYAPAQMALEDIVHGPDMVPASVAEKNLGALKEVVRNNTLTGGVKNEAGQLAADQVARLQADIDSTVKSIGGREALGELHQGRLEAYGKSAAIDLVDQFKAEPVRLYDQLTAKRDASIDLLRKVQTLAPEQMPALGRAWLDGALDQATAEGGFNKAQTLHTSWQNLGDQTKAVLFKNPAMIENLDKFFQSAKDSARVENPSGTARVGHIAGTLGMVVAHPVLGTGYVIGMNALSRLLYNPRFVRAAIGAMDTPANSAAGAAAASRLVAAAGSAAVPQSEAQSSSTAGPIATPAPGVPTSGNAGQAATGASQNQAVSGPIQASGGTGAPTATNAGRSVGPVATTVEVPGESGRGYQAEYRLQDLSDVNASHSGQSFQPNPRYQLRNDRDYANAVNQGKVVQWSSRPEFDPKYHVTDNPDASNGPMVVDSQGNVLGGNGRAMILDRVYSGNPKGAAAYKAMLKAKADQFGIDPAEVDRLNRPVLTRVIPDTELTKPGAKQAAVTDFNKKPTAELTPAERAVADSRRVSDATLEDVAARLDQQDKGAGASLADVLAGKGGGEVLHRLVTDGVITSQERAAFQDAKGELTPAGKDRISALMIGRFFEDPAQLETIPATIRAQVERVAAPLAQIEGKPDWNLTPHVKDALSMLDEAHKLGIKNVDDFIRQDGLFGGEKHSPEAVTLAKAFRMLKADALKAAMRQYASDANYASKGANTMFGDAPTPASAFRDAFGAVPKNALAPAHE